MLEALIGLIGVIIGGIITNIAPTVTSIINHRRWKQERKIEYLKDKRQKLEILINEALKGINEDLKTDICSSDTISDIATFMPKKIIRRYWEFTNKNEKTDMEKKHFYLEIALAMKEVLADIDNMIEKTVS